MPTIEQHPIGQCGYWGQLYRPLWFVVHFTGGTPNLQSLYNYWISQCNIGSNSHFGIERYDNAYADSGDIWQFLPLNGGAAANCCVEPGHAPFLPDENLNVRTISVECINPDTGNLGDMPPAQFDSLVYLIRTVCTEMGIPTNIYSGYWNGYENAHTWGNASGGIIMHRDIAPQNRKMCPGTPYYSGQMDAIIQAVNGGSNMAPVFIPPNRNKFFIEHWQAYYEAMGRLEDCPPRDTGIFNEAWKMLLDKHNIDLGSVISPELRDANYVTQHYTGGSITWFLDHYEWHATTGGGPHSS